MDAKWHRVDSQTNTSVIKRQGPRCLRVEERARALASDHDAPQVEVSDGCSSAPVVKLKGPPFGELVERAPATAPHVAWRTLCLRICHSLGCDPRVTVTSQVPRDTVTAVQEGSA